MNKHIRLPFIIAALMLGTVSALAEPQTTCPVMGGKVDKKLYVEVSEKRIYVCCAGCIKAIKADPEKYIKQMEAKGIELEKAQPKAKHDKQKSHEH